VRALIAAIALLAGGSAAAPPAQTLRTAGPVTLLAADGSLAAAVVEGDNKSRCTQVVLWRPGSKPVVIKTQVECDGGGPLEGVDELALGDNRVLWEETNGGDNLELSVETATVAKPKTQDLSYVESGAGAAGDPGGDYTGNLLADGPLLVFASWTSCDPYGGGYGRPCQKGQPDDYNGVLHRVVNGKDTVLRSGDDVLYPIWVDGGRILVRNGSKLTLLRTSGAALQTFDAGAGFQGAVFQGSNLVILRPTALDVYGTGTGTLIRTFHLKKAKRRLVDVQSGIAVLIGGGAVHLLRLDTGKGAGFTPTGGGTIQAQLEPTGLFMSSKTGLAFEPMARVLARFH
jgi:hypothetical protein